MRWNFWTAIALAGIILAAGAAPASAIGYKVIYTFQGSTDGAFPSGTLINVGGVLYGVAESGGAWGYGSVFALNPKTGAVAPLYSFKGQASNDGDIPMNSLINVRGRLYGTTRYGGTGGCAYGCGSVYSIDPATGTETVLHSFQGGSDGDTPVSGLINLGDLLYGTTYYGGGSGNCDTGCGTIYTVDPASGAVTVVYAFAGWGDGASPFATLLKAGGTLYGTTFYGGGLGGPSCNGLGCGTVFSLNSKTDTEAVLYAFRGRGDGADPYAGLVDVAGTMYGATSYNGSGCKRGICGTIFSLDPVTGTKMTVYAFKGGSGDGAEPLSGVIDGGGLLYGTTFYGFNAACKPSGCGTIFSLDPATGTESVVHAFQAGSDGANPLGGLLKLGSRLIGTTSNGGNHEHCKQGCGTVYEISP